MIEIQAFSQEECPAQSLPKMENTFTEKARELRHSKKRIANPLVYLSGCRTDTGFSDCDGMMFGVFFFFVILASLLVLW